MTTLKRKLVTIFFILLGLYTLISFFLVPFLIRHFGEKALQEHVNGASVIEKVRLNPFTLTLRVEGLSTADTAEAWSVKWASVEVNVGALTVLNFYLVFDRIALDGSDISVARELSTEVVEAEEVTEAPAEGGRAFLEQLN